MVYFFYVQDLYNCCICFLFFHIFTLFFSVSYFFCQKSIFFYIFCWIMHQFFRFSSFCIWIIWNLNDCSFAQNIDQNHNGIVGLNSSTAKNTPSTKNKIVLSYFLYMISLGFCAQKWLHGALRVSLHAKKENMHGMQSEIKHNNQNFAQKYDN